MKKLIYDSANQSLGCQAPIFLISFLELPCIVDRVLYYPYPTSTSNIIPCGNTIIHNPGDFMYPDTFEPLDYGVNTNLYFGIENLLRGTCQYYMNVTVSDHALDNAKITCSLFFR